MTLNCCIVLYITLLVVGLVYSVYYFTCFYCLYNLAYWLQYLNKLTYLLGSGLGFLVWAMVGPGFELKLEFGGRVKVMVDLASDIDPLSQESYGHDPYVQKVKVKVTWFKS